jgi:hypothetical protein
MRMEREHTQLYTHRTKIGGAVQERNVIGATLLVVLICTWCIRGFAFHGIQAISEGSQDALAWLLEDEANRAYQAVVIGL